MRYGNLYRTIELNKDFLTKIDNTISNMDLQIKKSLVNKKESNRRVSKQAWIRDASLCKYFFGIGQKVNELCKWNFDIKGIEPIQYTEYSDGGKYDWHTDQGSKILLKDGSIRKISMTLFMNNPDEYEGGEFDLELFDPEKNPRYETFKLKKGSAIFFQADVWHRVRPVSSGVRKSLVAWYSGPTFK